MIYGKGESGRTSFQSATGSQHPKLVNDPLPFFRNLTKEVDIKLFLYWSGLEDLIAGTEHPEWRMLSPEQKPIRTFQYFVGEDLAPYAMCPQSSFFDEWAGVQLREALEKSNASGMWVDGTWLGPCYCTRCTGRFQRETRSNEAVPSGDDWVRYWSKVQYEFRGRWLQFVRSIKPDFLCSFGNITVLKPYLDDRDWSSGDWYSPNNHRLQQSIVMRRYTSVNIPYEAWICDTQMMHALHDVRPRTKSLDRMLQEGAGILANGGQWTYWTFPMPSGALVPSRMQIATKACDFAREREDVCLFNHAVNWTGVLTANPDLRWWNNNIWGAGKALIHLHRSPDLIDESNLKDDMLYDLIVLPEQEVLEPSTIERLELFVRRGGKLLSTGTCARTKQLQQLLGIRIDALAAVNEGHVFLKNRNPVGLYAAWDKCELIQSEEMYPMYLSAGASVLKTLPVNWSTAGEVDEKNPAPANIPAATIRRLGKGVIVHIPADIFGVYWEVGYLDILEWLREIVTRMDPQPLFRTDAYTYVEVALRQRSSTLLVHFVNGNPGRDLSMVHTEDLWVDEIPRLGPFTSWIRCGRRPGKCTWEPGGKLADVSWNDGVLQVTLPGFEIHTCLKIEAWQRPA